MKKAIFILLGIVLLILNYSCEKEEELILNQGEIKDELHQSNIGKITFMKAIIPYEDFTKNDFIRSFNLKQDKDVNIRFFLAKTITYYLHELEPELTVNELAKKGNFQFNFYVDQKLIYSENLDAGAGSPSYKNTAVIYRRPLISSTDEDSWGRFLWIRFMKKGGGQKALNEGTHQLKIEIKPYIKTDKVKTGKVIAKGEVTVHVKNKMVKEEQIAIQTIEPYTDFKISSDKYDIEKIRALNKKIAQNDFREITSIVAIKKGELLIEEYFNNANRETLHDTRSVGKSFASTLVGIAIKDGHIKNENQTLKEFYTLKKYKNYTISKANITLKDLLTMRSGLDGDDSNMESPGYEEKMYPSSNWMKFTLDLPMNKNSTTGKSWYYISAGSALLGGILDKSLPNGLENYAHKKLFEPLHIQNYKWQYTPTKIPNTAGGLQMNSLDYAKYGQLYKNEGNWNDKQIVTKKWVELSLAKQQKLPNEMKGYYGYLFWNKEYNYNNTNYEVSFSSGNGGNKIFIFKDLPLVVVITAKAYNSPEMHFQVDEIIENYILPAILKE